MNDSIRFVLIRRNLTTFPRSLNFFTRHHRNKNPQTHFPLMVSRELDDIDFYDHGARRQVDDDMQSPAPGAPISHAAPAEIFVMPSQPPAREEDPARTPRARPTGSSGAHSASPSRSGRTTSPPSGRAA